MSIETRKEIFYEIRCDGCQGVKNTTPSRRSQSVGALGGYYPKTDNNKKLNQALEQSPIGLKYRRKSIFSISISKIN